jgi:hypothetical protein
VHWRRDVLGLAATAVGQEAEALSREVLDLQVAAVKAASTSVKSLARSLQEEARLRTRQLFRLIQTSRRERSDKERLAQLQSFVGRLTGSVGFAVRTLTKRSVPAIRFLKATRFASESMR